MGDNDSNRSQTPPNNNSSPRSSRQWPEEDNPFVALRRFADENISSVLQSFMGLPSMITPPSTEKWSILASRHYDNQRSRQSGDTSADSGEEAPNDAYHYYSSGFSGSPAMPQPDSDEFPPLASRFMLPFQYYLDCEMRDPESWPLPFLGFSPYSPLNLDQRPQRKSGGFSSLMSSLGLSGNDKDSARDDAHEPRWKEAFEDLLRLENGKPMLDREPGAVNQEEVGTNWVRGMIQRGSMGDHWILVAQNQGQSNGIYIVRLRQSPSSSEQPSLDDRTDVESRQTEQDMYEQFLQDLEDRQRETSNQSRTLLSLLEDRAGFPPRRKPLLQNLEDIEASFLSGDAAKDNPVPETMQSSTSSSLSSATEVQQDEPTTDAAPAQPRVISTQTETNRVHMADGSIHTKTVKTQRFADGHEESNESVDVVNPLERQDPAAAAAAAGGTDQESAKSSGNGWFWKD